ncbi:YmdB family metallophosphoesterase [Terrilactibacillus sp. S3-3]|nr:YmdB family metallophosphoesterase [Terrilactibacillus sp. S3-3]
MLRILFIGDIYGKLGREMVETYLSKLKSHYHPTVTIVNGENAAHGKGLTKKIYSRLMELGADMITMGNHTWDNRDIFLNLLMKPADWLDRLISPMERPAPACACLQSIAAGLR